jgi:hypothetical protein
MVGVTKLKDFALLPAVLFFCNCFWQMANNLIDWQYMEAMERSPLDSGRGFLVLSVVFSCKSLCVFQLQSIRGDERVIVNKCT